MTKKHILNQCSAKHPLSDAKNFDSITRESVICKQISCYKLISIKLLLKFTGLFLDFIFKEVFLGINT
jgi:hypothetical protein